MVALTHWRFVTGMLSTVLFSAFEFAQVASADPIVLTNWPFGDSA